MEGRKYLIIPFQVKWYNDITKMELENIERGKIEDIGDKVDNAISEAKEQLEYYYLH